MRVYALTIADNWIERGRLSSMNELRIAIICASRADESSMPDVSPEISSKEAVENKISRVGRERERERERARIYFVRSVVASATLIAQSHVAIGAWKPFIWAENWEPRAMVVREKGLAVARENYRVHCLTWAPRCAEGRRRFILSLSLFLSLPLSPFSLSSFGRNCEKLREQIGGYGNAGIDVRVAPSMTGENAKEREREREKGRK